MDRKRLLFLLEVAIFGGLSFVLDKIGFSLPQGGSITLSMLPIIIIAFRWGIVGGILTGLLSGYLQVLSGAYIIHPVQGALDYFVSYGSVGLAALTGGWLLRSKKAGDKKSMTRAIVVGTVIGGLFRFTAHFLGGIVFFAQYATFEPVWLYSLVYNGTYMVPSIILSGAIAAILFTSAPRLLKRT